MKKKCLMICFLVWTFLSFSEIKEINREIIFVIDVSQSMKKDGLFEKLKKDIREYIKKEIAVGDEVSILTFGTKITIDSGNYISNTKNIEQILKKISELEASEKYTYMSKAVDEMALLMKRVNLGSKRVPVVAFLFTDGINEPPPSAGVEALPLDTIIKKHFETFKRPSNFIYIFTIGSKVEKGLKNLASKVDNVHLKEIDEVRRVKLAKSKKNILSNIKSLSFSPSVFDVEIRKGETKKINLNIKLVDLNGINQYKVDFVTDCDFIDPKKFSIIFSKKQKKYTVPLMVNINDISDERFYVQYGVNTADDVKISPKKIVINLLVKKPIVEIFNKKNELKIPVSGGEQNIKIKGELEGIEKDKLFLSIDNKMDCNISVYPNNFEISKGKFVKEVVVKAKSPNVKRENFNLKVSANNSEVKNGIVKLNVRFYKPMNYMGIIKRFGPIVLIIFLGLLISLFFRKINKKFAEWKIVGFGIDESLDIFKPWYSLKLVVGEDVFEDVIGEPILKIYLPVNNVFSGGLKVVSLIEGLNGLEVNGPVNITNIQFNYKGKSFSIKRNEEDYNA